MGSKLLADQRGDQWTLGVERGNLARARRLHFWPAPRRTSRWNASRTDSRRFLLEGRNLAHKEALSSRLVVTVAAVANTWEGIFLVGVDRTRQPVGVSESAVDQVA